MSKKDRIHFKLWLTLLGAFLLLFLFFGKVVSKLPGEFGEKHWFPAEKEGVKIIHNGWIMDAMEDRLCVFAEGQEQSYGYAPSLKLSEKYQVLQNYREQIADITLQDGLVTDINSKTERIHGIILGADDFSVEVEGIGEIPLAEHYTGYRIVNQISSITAKDLAFGYDFADFILEDGEICAILVVREASMETIRVLIETSDYDAKLHDRVELTCDTDFVVRYGSYREEEAETITAGTVFCVDADSSYFTGERILIQPVVHSGRIQLQNVKRSQTDLGYRGHLELIREADKVAVVNELLLEEYLYSVVPSEMPSDYPDGALRAQAVCARTYAYGHMQHAAYPQYGAHVDDSTAYQVYNNRKEQESTTRAVMDTYGEVLYAPDGSLAETYYYSTSCGAGSDAGVWKTEAAKNLDYLKPVRINPDKASLYDPEELKGEEEFRAFIGSVGQNDFEREEGWYRWTYSVDRLSVAHLRETLKARYQANDQLVQTYYKGRFESRKIQNFSEVEDLFISQRGSGGVADELIIRTDKGIYKVISEYNIRAVLCDGETKVLRQTLDEVSMPSLLPSAFFVIDTGKEDGNVIGYTLTGGGFGHGVGMSQNGTKAMADAGYSCEEILRFFYENCTLKSMY